MASKSKAPEQAQPNDATVASSLSTAQFVRLECTKLAYRHDRTPADVIARAAEIERFVMIGRPAPDSSGNDGQGEPDPAPI